MTEEDIRRVVHQMRLEDEEKAKSQTPAADVAMLKTISAILTSFGIPDDERKDIAEDFRYLRRWRLGAERIQGIGLTAVVALLIGGLVSALGLGIKAMFK